MKKEEDNYFKNLALHEIILVGNVCQKRYCPTHFQHMLGTEKEFMQTSVYSSWIIFGYLEYKIYFFNS